MCRCGRNCPVTPSPDNEQPQVTTYDELLRLAAEATEGPWSWSVEDDYWAWSLRGRPAGSGDWFDASVIESGFHEGVMRASAVNRDFIAAARNFLTPARIRRLQA